jgi:hypothetical protein
MSAADPSPEPHVMAVGKRDLRARGGHGVRARGQLLPPDGSGVPETRLSDLRAPEFGWRWLAWRLSRETTLFWNACACG